MGQPRSDIKFYFVNCVTSKSRAHSNLKLLAKQRTIGEISMGGWGGGGVGGGDDTYPPKRLLH